MKEWVERVLLAASWAPSPENNQPWSFRAEGEIISIYYNPERALQTDPQHYYNWLSIGAAIENMRIAGEKEGFLTQVRYAEPGEDSELAAEISFLPRESEDSPSSSQGDKSLYPYIFSRFTDRSDSKEQAPLPREYYLEIERQALKSSVQLVFVNRPGDLKVWGKTIGYLNRLRFFSQIFHREISKSLYFSKQEYESRRDGIWIGSLHLPFGAMPLFRLLMRWSWARILRVLGVGFIIQQVVSKQVALSSALLLIIPKDEAKPSLLEAGQLMQRAWLHAERYQISCYPLGEIPIFSRLTEDLYRMSGLSDQKDLIGKRIAATLGGLGLEGRLPIMVLRMSWGRREQSIRLRYPLEKLLR